MWTAPNESFLDLHWKSLQWQIRLKFNCMNISKSIVCDYPILSNQISETTYLILDPTFFCLYEIFCFSDSDPIYV